MRADKIHKIGEDDKEVVSPPDDINERVTLSPISPRFTDYYNFATQYQTENIEMENEVVATAESAVLPKGTDSFGNMNHVDID